MFKDLTNGTKIIICTAIAAVATIIVQLTMYHQAGASLLSGAVLGRVAFMAILGLVVAILALYEWRFNGYITILAMILWALANFGGLTQVADRLSFGGILIQIIAIAGFLASLCGVWYGIIQRKQYTEHKLEERLK